MYITGSYSRVFAVEMHRNLARSFLAKYDARLPDAIMPCLT